MVINIAASDQREFITFYGYYTDDWKITFGSFSDHKYILGRDYLSEGCSTTESSLASTTHKFIYPHHIKKTYFIEGVAEGEISVAANGGAATVTSYRVTICKVHDDGSDDELVTTGWITVSDTLAWDAGIGVGEEMVYHFWIDIWASQKLTDMERIYIKIEFNSNAYAYLMHSNDKTWTDVWIDIPFQL